MSRVARTLPALLLLAAAAPLASCFDCDDEPDLSCGGPPHRRSCPTGGCVEAFYWGGLVLDLPPLGDGSYSLEGSADGEPFSCPFVVAGGPPDVRCSDWQSTWLEGDLVVGLAATPCALTVALRDGQGVIASATVRPDYAWDRPGGDECNEWRGLARVALARSPD